MPPVALGIPVLRRDPADAPSMAGRPETDALVDKFGRIAQDLRVSMRSLHNHDFAEGIRAQVIDKDRAPRWEPATVAEVTPELVDSFFAPLYRELGD